METRDEKVERIKGLHRELTEKMDNGEPTETLEELSQQMTTVFNELEELDRQGGASC